MRRDEDVQVTLDQILPWTEDPITCLRCYKTWIAVRQIGVDYRRLPCPFCAAQDSELAREAPLGLFLKQ